MSRMMIDSFVRAVKEIKSAYAEINEKSKELQERIMLECNGDQLVADFLMRCVTMIADGKLDADQVELTEGDQDVVSLCLRSQELITLGSEEVEE